MSVTIDRTNYNALVDDSGSNTDGTFWNKNQIKIVLLDAIDTALALLLPAAGGTISGALALTNKISTYNNVATAADGIPHIVSYQRITGQTNVNTGNFASFTPASDGTFIVYCNVTITASSNHSFSVFISYRDETNTSNSVLALMGRHDGSSAGFTQVMANAQGAIAYAGVPICIRVKGGTTINLSTGGTVTGVTYNIEGAVVQVA